MLIAIVTILPDYGFADCCSHCILAGGPPNTLPKSASCLPAGLAPRRHRTRRTKWRRTPRTRPFMVDIEALFRAHRG
eukprot:14505727-Alexandrium_andersonii.AAC.1